MRRFIGITIGIVVTFIFAIGGLFAVEIGFRVFGLTSRGTLADVLLFPYAPYYLSTQTPGVAFKQGVPRSSAFVFNYFDHSECDTPEGVVVRFNSEGFRSPEFRDVPPKQPGEIRVIVTGGSVAVSWNVGEHCTLDANLKRELERRYPGCLVRVFNLASGAWVSMQELIALQIHGLSLAPDVVIAFDGFNDIEHSYSMAVNQPYTDGLVRLAFEQHGRWLTAGVRELFDNLRFPSVISSYLWPRGNQIAGSGGSRAQLPETAEAPKPGGLASQPHWPLDFNAIARRTDFDPQNRLAVETYLRNERSLARMVSGVGGKILFALQPTLFLKESMSQSERDVILPPYFATVNYVAQGYLRAQEGLRDLVRSEPNAKFVDFSNAFSGDDAHIFGDYAHMNARGYSIIAARMADEIAPWIAQTQTEPK